LSDGEKTDMEIKELKTRFTGRVIGPEDVDYDKTRQLFYGGFDKKPAIIVRVLNDEDIRKAISLSKERNLELAVRSGGHSVAGYSSADGGMVIDLRDMKKLDINVSQRSVWAETGSTAIELTNELDKYDFVLGFGDTGSVGIGGITLGGGIGYLVRKFGLTIDNLLAAEIITADGQVLQTDKEHHPDLFWAIRGGGGNFGVVSKFKYALHDLSECYGGMLLLPATANTIWGCIEIANKASEELSAIFNIMPAPPMPFVPSEYHGKLSIMALIMFAGSSKDGEKAIAPIRDLTTPLVDMVKTMRYKGIFFPEDENYHPTAVSRNIYLKNVELNTAKLIVEWLNKIEAPMKALQLRVLGGAMAKIPTSETAYAHRHNAIMGNIAAFYQTEKEKEERQQWVDDFSGALSQGDSAGYVGFLGPAEQDRLHDAYPEETLQRLRKIKKQYDPENLFRMNFNF
jgi:FAD/FMN-containing dehydrogenase